MRPKIAVWSDYGVPTQKHFAVPVAPPVLDRPQSPPCRLCLCRRRHWHQRHLSANHRFRVGAERFRPRETSCRRRDDNAAIYNYRRDSLVAASHRDDDGRGWGLSATSRGTCVGFCRAVANAEFGRCRRIAA
jgi:hypothetical protein